MTAPCVLLCISHGFHVRNLLYGPFFARLRSQCRVVVLMPETVTIPDADRRLFQGVDVEFLSARRHRFEHFFTFLRKNVFAGRERTQTFNLITEGERARHPVMYRVANVLNAFFGRFRVFSRIWCAFEAIFIDGEEFADVFSRHAPRVVVTANYGTEPVEIRLIRAARRRGIASVAVIPSWDNLSSKGVIGAEPAHLSVWNPIMFREALDLYDFTRDRVHVNGGLQFDLYAEPACGEVVDEVFDRLGIDGSRPFIVVGTITPRYFSKNIDIVEILDRGIDQGLLPADLQIVVRLHPQVVHDPVFGDDLGAYHALAERSGRVRLSIPRVLDWRGISPPLPEDGVERLMVLLRHAAASVMPASTLAIDACALDCPVVGIGFDGYEQRPYETSVRRTFDFTHYARLVAQGGLRIAESRDDLLEEVSAYLAERDRDRAGRAKVVESHLGSVDGRAWERLLALVSTLVDGERGP